MKVGFMGMIASFDSKSNNLSVQFMSEVNCFEDQSNL